jgi:hypothetical protein
MEKRETIQVIFSISRYVAQGEERKEFSTFNRVLVLKHSVAWVMQAKKKCGGAESRRIRIQVADWKFFLYN